MLSEIRLTHFKCFETLVLPISPLTILSGSNASGKSSVMQALVLLHQTMRAYEWSDRLFLNGAAVKLGTVLDVVDKVHGRRGFEIGLTGYGATCQWRFTGERSEMSLTVESLRVNGRDSSAKSLRHLVPVDAEQDVVKLTAALSGLTYITAERVGPREVYVLEDREVAPVVGPAGEHAVSVLHWGRDKQVVDGLALPGGPSTRLRQVEERMRMFFPGCGITVQQVPQVNAVTLGLRTSSDTDFHRPANVGFGMTQVLPIVIAAISARPGDVLLIENPEVHLHPSGQALVGLFLAEVARSGVQVVIETHSDHVLNGIRRSVRSEIMAPENVSIHYFSARGGVLSQVVSPSIDSRGNIDFWPEGFFDQFDKDSSHFAGWE